MPTKDYTERLREYLESAEADSGHRIVDSVQHLADGITVVCYGSIYDTYFDRETVEPTTRDARYPKRLDPYGLGILESFASIRRLKDYEMTRAFAMGNLRLKNGDTFYDPARPVQEKL